MNHLLLLKIINGLLPKKLIAKFVIAILEKWAEDDKTSVNVSQAFVVAKSIKESFKL